MKRVRKIRGMFCERTVAPKRAFEPTSFRYKKSGKTWVVVGCPRGSFDAARERCLVGTRAHTIMTPATGGRCPAGAHRVDKR